MNLTVCTYHRMSYNIQAIVWLFKSVARLTAKVCQNMYIQEYIEFTRAYKFNSSLKFEYARTKCLIFAINCSKNILNSYFFTKICDTNCMYVVWYKQNTCRHVSYFYSMYKWEV